MIQTLSQYPFNCLLKFDVLLDFKGRSTKIFSFSVMRRSCDFCFGGKQFSECYPISKGTLHGWYEPGFAWIKASEQSTQS